MGDIATKMLGQLQEALDLESRGLVVLDLIPTNCTMYHDEQFHTLDLPIYGELSIIWTSAPAFVDGGGVVVEAGKLHHITADEEETLEEAFLWMCTEKRIR